jgi:hypothetical protein
MKFQKISTLNKLSLLFLTTFCITFVSCRNKKNDKLTPYQISLTQLLVGDGTHQFRKVSLGIDAKSVLLAEKKKPEENDTNYIFYTLAMDTLYPDSVGELPDTLNYFNIAYNFDQQKLNEIDEDIYLSTDSAAALLQSRLSDYFTSKYGDGTKESDHTVWKMKKINGKTSKLSLSDESEEYDYGKLSLVYYLED